MKQPLAFIPALFHLVATKLEFRGPKTTTAVTLAQWTYKAIFRVNDQRVGQWSDEVSITVGG